jgi:cytochrome c-type biogenesis protein CcmF
VLLSGLGPVIAWRRATPANLKHNVLKPAAFALAVVVVVALVAGAAKPLALAMFGFGSFTLAVVTQELWRGTRARRIMAGEAPPVAFYSLLRRNRRRYGGYIVHAGIALLFIGVAASSAFQDVREVSLQRGESARVGGYELTYAKTTAGLVAAPNGRLERIDLGAQLRVRRDGRDEGTLVTRKSYFPTMDPSLGVVSRFFEGEATSEVGLRAGWRRDLWAAVAPDIGRLQARIAEGDQVFAAADLPKAQRDVYLAQALRALAASYQRAEPAATFRIIVSPLVSWIWLGALVVFAGALIALAPPPSSGSRPVSAAYAARVARETRGTPVGV